MLAFFRDERKRAIIDQILFLSLAALFIYYLGSNLVTNLNRLGISTGFGFLWQEAGYDIGFSLIPYTLEDSFFRAHLVGLVNTLLATFLIIISVTFVGFVVGILRMSDNPLMRNVIRYAIELVRNIPSLVHIIILFTLTLNLPGIRQSINLFDTFFICNRGIYGPKPTFLLLFIGVLIIFVILLIAAYYRSKKAIQLLDTTGEYKPTLATNLLMIGCGTAASYYMLGSPIEWSIPVMKGFNFKGGFSIVAELFALWVALTIYFSSHVAELVRGGIQSVEKGQFEAASALGVKSKFTMRLIVIPQALRVIIPPLTNVYQNILKTTSLGVSIGYVEMTALTGGTTLNLTGQAIECILLLMVSYGVIGIIIAMIMNVLNTRFAIVGS